VKSYI